VRGATYPGLAVAQALCQRDEHAQVVFLATERAIDQRILDESGFAYHMQPIRPVPRRPGAVVDFYRRWRRSIKLCRELIERYRPVALLGLGGYASGPALKVAAQCKLPRAILNPDALPGIANRYCKRHAQQIYVQWDQSVGRFGNDAHKCLVTGCAVRASVLNGSAQDDGNGALSSEQNLARGQARRALQLDADLATLVVVGGSQGGRSLNEAVIAWLTRKQGPERARPDASWQVLHLTGAAEQASVQRAYEQADANVAVMGYCERMDRVYRAADCMISRAGASTLAELTALGVPSVLMPYPYHRDQHQRHNAEVLANAGAAKIVTDCRVGQKTADELARLWHDIIKGGPNPGGSLDAMRHQARTLGRPQAAGEIAAHLRHLATTP